MARYSPSDGRLYRWLLLLFLLAVNCQILFTIDALRDATGRYVLAPVFVAQWPVVSSVNYRVQDADVKPGDRVAAVNGRAVVRRGEFAAVMRAARPGETLRVAFDRGGRRTEVSYRLRGILPHATAGMWIFGGVSWLFMPWLCIAVGFWVALQRPRDERAWLLLGMLLGMAVINRPEILDPLGWPDPFGAAAYVYRTVAALAWPVCMMLFGFYFPQRWRFDRRAPWFKWLLLAPACTLGLWDIVAGQIAPAMGNPGLPSRR